MRPKIRRVAKEHGGIIPRQQEVQSAVAASFAQERMFVLNELSPDVSVYGNPAHYWLQGPLDTAALERTLTALLRRHEPLRTIFGFEGMQLIQIVKEPTEVTLDCVDLTHLSEHEAKEQALHIAADNSRQPFDLKREVPVRWRLVRISPVCHLLVQTFHHIAFDGWSARILRHELTSMYAASTAGKEPNLSPLPIQYADYALWQRETIADTHAQEHIDYWLEELKGELPVLSIASDRPRPAVETFAGGIVERILSPELTDDLKSLGRQHGATLFMVLLAAYNVLLNRYTSATDIIVGCPIAGRDVTEVEALIGLFVNTLALRTDLSGRPTFLEVLARVRSVCMGGFAHQNVPFELLVQKLNPSRTSGPNPIFQALFQLRNLPATADVMSDVLFEPCPVEMRLARADLGIDVLETPDGLKLTAEYSTDLFDASSIERMLGHYEELLKGIVAEPSQRISHLPVLSEAELQMQLHEWNQTAAPFPENKCLHSLFEVWAAAKPDAPAIMHRGDALTYAEVNERANQIAHHLIAIGVEIEDPVVLYMNRHSGLLVTLLGVMKSGAVVVPVDHRHPSGRIADVLANSGAKLVVTEKMLTAAIADCEAEVFIVDQDETLLHAYPNSCPAVNIAPENLAYILYTSGSTGKPKGVAVEHRGAVCRVYGAESMDTAGAREGVLVTASISFDVSMYEIFCALCRGLHVVLLDSALEFLDGLPPGRYGHMNCPPSVMRELLRHNALPRCIRTLLIGAEVVTREDVARLLELGHIDVLYNMYGPTETIMWCTSKLIDTPSTTDPTIGRPATNTSAYVLDDNLQPVPVGVPGELWIGGAGLARCYYNAPELTAEAFITNPFDGSGGRIYRTGDLVKYRSDGELEFLGRRDHQVKIRGFRVELEGVQSTLNEHPEVQQSVVTIADDASGSEQLVAYFVPAHDGAVVSSKRLREWMSKRVPDYTIPHIFMQLDAMPRLTNGKINLQGLPVPVAIEARSGADERLPETPIEREIAAVFGDVLHRADLTAQSHFFDLGGHSLMATMAVSRIRDRFDVEMTLGAFFAHPTVEGVSLSVAALMLRQMEMEEAEAAFAELENEQMDHTSTSKESD